MLAQPGFAWAGQQRPCIPTAEEDDLKSFQCGFDSHQGHGAPPISILLRTIKSVHGFGGAAKIITITKGLKDSWEFGRIDSQLSMEAICIKVMILLLPL